jgi:TPR repeat protein
MYRTLPRVRAALFLALAAAPLAAPLRAQTADRGPKRVDPLRAAPRFYKKVQALCVGVNKYQSERVDQLKWAERDAQAVAEVLRTHYKYQVDPLIGPRATKAAILDKIREYKGQLGPDDALLLFFAVHGQSVPLDKFGRAGYLVPYNANVDLEDTRDPKEWEREAIGMRQLGELLSDKDMKCRHVLLLVDSCFSGFLGRRSGFGERPDLLELVTRKSRVAITAGTEDERSYESEDLRHSYFTHALLMQLRKNEPLSVMEVFAEVRRDVARLSKRRMLPQFREIVVDNGEFVFIPGAIQEEQIREALQRTSDRIKSRGARFTKLSDVYEASFVGDYRYAEDADRQKTIWEAKLKRVEENAAIGDPYAMVCLHYCYAAGLGAERDPRQAYRWAVRTHELGLPVGKHILARCYFWGWGVTANPAVARKLLEEAAKEGFAISQYNIALELVFNPARAKQPLTAEENSRVADMLTKSAAQAYPPGQVILALVYRNGWAGLPQDGTQAVSLARKAAAAGCPTAYRTLAEFHHHGIPPALRKDSAEERKWLEKGASAGNSFCQAILAERYFYGRYGLERDFTKALEWAQLAAAQNSPRGLLVLAIASLEGKGVPVDYEEAKKHLEKAVAMNDAGAITLQADWYANGKPYSKNLQRARELYERAAELNYPEAYYWAARAYEEEARATTGNWPKELELRKAMFVRFVKAERLGVKMATDKLAWYRQRYPAEVREAENAVGADFRRLMEGTMMRSTLQSLKSAQGP